MAQLNQEALAQAIDRIRPYLRADGGDLEVANLREDGILEVRLLGSCRECPLSVMTLRAGIERALLLEFEDLRRVEQVR